MCRFYRTEGVARIVTCWFAIEYQGTICLQMKMYVDIHVLQKTRETIICRHMQENIAAY